jgi:hypothetical protein
VTPIPDPSIGIAEVRPEREAIDCEPPLPGATTRRASIFGTVSSLVGRLAVSAAAIGAILGGLAQGPPAASVVAAPMVEVAAHAEAAPRATKLAPMFRAILAIPTLADLDPDDARTALRRLAFSVQTNDTIASSPDAPIQIPKGTRISASLDRTALDLSTSPRIDLPYRWLTQATIGRIGFDFHQARFDAEASGLGLDRWYTAPLVRRANAHLGEVSAALRTPGYDPFADPRIAESVDSVLDAVIATFDADAKNGPPLVDAAKLSKPSLGISLFIREPRSIALLEGKYTAWIEAKTDVSITVDCSGPLTDLRLARFAVDFDPPLTITKAGGDPHGFANVRFDGLVLLPNGKLALDIDQLGSEALVDDLRLLWGILVDRTSLARLEPTRSDEARQDLEAHIAGIVEPEIRRWVKAHDDALAPGIRSLSTLLSFDP